MTLCCRLHMCSRQVRICLTTVGQGQCMYELPEEMPLCELESSDSHRQTQELT